MTREETLSAIGAHLSLAPSGDAQPPPVRHRADEYGDEEAELARLADGAALVDLGHEDAVEVSGPDAADFLNRLLTLDIRRLESGRGGRAFLLDARGRVLAAVHLYRLDPQRFTARVAGGYGAALLAALDGFHFGERLTLTARAGIANLGVFGPRAGEVIAPLLAGSVLERGDVQAVALGERPGWLLRRDRLGHPGYELWVEDAAFPHWWASLIDHCDGPAGSRALERRRICDGAPLWPKELSPAVTPLEVTGLDGVSEGKGCYPGQEVIERTLALGRPARVLRRFRLNHAAEPGPLTIDAHLAPPLPAESASAISGTSSAGGDLTSVARDHLGQWWGLGLIKQRHAQWTGPFQRGEAVAHPVTDPE